MGEETIFQVMELPEGTDWVWHGDLNVVSLSSRLDLAGRLHAVAELQEHWQRSHLKLVETA